MAAQETQMKAQWDATQVKQRAVGELRYAADSWKLERRIVTRLEYGAQGNNPRFVVTNLGWDAARLYDEFYCLRGEAENRIKEAQLDLFGTRALSQVRRQPVAAAVCRAGVHAHGALAGAGLEGH